MVKCIPKQVNHSEGRCFQCRIRLLPGEGRYVHPDGMPNLACTRCGGSPPRPGERERVSLTMVPLTDPLHKPGLVQAIPSGALPKGPWETFHGACDATGSAWSGQARYMTLMGARRVCEALGLAGFDVVIDDEVKL